VEKTSTLSLLRSVRRLDKRALTEVYDQFSPGLYRYAVRQLGHVDLAEECVADTFSRFLQALQRGGGPREHIQAYLYRIAQNWITDFYRRSPQISVELTADLALDENESPYETVAAKLEQDQVREALTKLTIDQRQVIVLKFLEGWSNKDIAQALDKPVGAVKSLQHRGLARLKRILDQDRKNER
jgi:RNA polymerase sigma-70 factor (ECF subfamily)